MGKKTKISTWDLIKLKRFCTSNETINKTKRQATLRMGENICKRSKRQVINLQNIQTAHAVLGQKKKQATNQKMRGRPKIDISPKTTFRWPTKYMKRCLTSLVITEMKIETAMRLSPHTSQNGHRKKTYKQ